MSEMYEGIVFRCEEPSARAAFDALVSPLPLRLILLFSGIYGVYRVAGRADPFAPAAVENVAAELSARVGQAVALFYDNRSGVEAGVLYADGRPSREFGEADGQWVQYGDSGELFVDGPRLRIGDLRPDCEYDCVFSPMDAALQAIGAWPQTTGSLVKQAFCYDDCDVLAVSAGGA